MNSSTKKTMSPIPSKLMQLRKKRICRFCKDGARYIDYKDIKILSAYASERGRIPPRRITGNCAFHQRRLTQAIKRARTMGLLSFVAS